MSTKKQKDEKRYQTLARHTFRTEIEKALEANINENSTSESEKSILNRFATFGICISFIFPTGTIGFILCYKDISNLNII